MIVNIKNTFSKHEQNKCAKLRIFLCHHVVCVVFANKKNQDFATYDCILIILIPDFSLRLHCQHKMPDTSESKAVSVYLSKQKAKKEKKKKKHEKNLILKTVYTLYTVYRQLLVFLVYSLLLIL